MSGRWTSAWTCVLFCATGCSRQDPVTHAGFGFPDSVQSKMIAYGCPTCHVIPGVPGGHRKSRAVAGFAFTTLVPCRAAGQHIKQSGDLA